ncbi:MAG: hypothetical protein M0R80_28095 [Proteobacteria bacterium]|jgi:hypothetical protein|nr:hypothetical protein [Pseudomonadota bacterium]
MARKQRAHLPPDREGDDNAIRDANATMSRWADERKKLAAIDEVYQRWVEGGAKRGRELNEVLRVFEANSPPMPIEDIIEDSLSLYRKNLHALKSAPLGERSKTIPARRRRLRERFALTEAAVKRLCECRIEMLAATRELAERLAEYFEGRDDEVADAKWVAQFVLRLQIAASPIPDSIGPMVEWLDGPALRSWDVHERLLVPLLSVPLRIDLELGPDPQSKPVRGQERENTWYRMLSLLVAEGLSDKEIRHRLRDAKQRHEEEFASFSADWLRLVDKYLREIHEEMPQRRKRRSSLR